MLNEEEEEEEEERMNGEQCFLFPCNCSFFFYFIFSTKNGHDKASKYNEIKVSEIFMFKYVMSDTKFID